MLLSCRRAKGTPSVQRHHDSTPRLLLQYSIESPRQFLECYGAHDILQMARLEICRQALPYRAPHRDRRVAGVDADQAHTAQDKWQHSGAELDTAGVTETCNQTVLLHAPRKR